MSRSSACIAAWWSSPDTSSNSTSGPLQKNYERILAWCVVSGSFAVAGGLADGLARELLWLLAVGTDAVGGLTGFATPGLGRSRTSDWTIEGGPDARWPWSRRWRRWRRRTG